ncbi:MAG: OmpA family protein [Deltaproteobacteria bacterium]|nr:OmpA family protein [Deltaproteobacteria bacterium]
MKNIVRMAVCLAVVLGSWSVARAEHDDWMEVPQIQNPDACSSTLQNREPCTRWYVLTEVENPASWKTDRYNEPNQRWYGLGQPKKKVIVYSDLKGVRFDFDKHNIREEARPILQKDVAELKSDKTDKIHIIGYTDSIGSDQYNKSLSAKRALEVKEYFIRQGVDPSLITVEGRGKANPVAPNIKPDGSDNPMGRAENRRIELHVN